MSSTATASTRPSTATEEHLKDIVGVHSTHPTSSSSLINLFYVSAILVHFALLLVGKHGIRLAYVLELGLCIFLFLFGPLAVLIWVPLDRSLPIRLLDFRLTSTFVHAQDSVVILALALLHF